jgi:hypothetical protein
MVPAAGANGGLVPVVARLSIDLLVSDSFVSISMHDEDGTSDVPSHSTAFHVVRGAPRERVIECVLAGLHNVTARGSGGLGEDPAQPLAVLTPRDLLAVVARALGEGLKATMGDGDATGPSDANAGTARPPVGERSLRLVGDQGEHLAAPVQDP